MQNLYVNYHEKYFFFPTENMKQDFIDIFNILVKIISSRDFLMMCFNATKVRKALKYVIKHMYATFELPVVIGGQSILY